MQLLKKKFWQEDIISPVAVDWQKLDWWCSIPPLKRVFGKVKETVNMAQANPNWPRASSTTSDLMHWLHNAN